MLSRVLSHMPGPVTRRVVELKEYLLLSPFAGRSSRSRGRQIAELSCPYRTIYARDRDRVIHSVAFMLLAGKTQVFSAEALALPQKQLVHNRLFHVLKVAQIARDICRALGLNEDLAEAIALGHDLGHSPFGHEGERVLNDLSMRHLEKPFKHNRQSLRVVDTLEELNLSFEVRDGIVRHDGEKKDPILRPSKDFTLHDREFPTTMEGCVVRIADRIAYLPTDLEDALILGVVAREGIPAVVKEHLGTTASEIIDALVRDVIASSWGRNYITMSERSRRAMDALFEFNYKHIYFGKLKMDYVETIEKCITALFNHFTQEKKISPQEEIDAIVAMTDQQALSVFRETAQK